MADNEIITADGEIIEQGSALMLIDDAMAGTLARAEIDMQIATAHKFPRSIRRSIDNILSLATLDEQTAVENIYALKRGGKPIRGPSIRLAEIIATQWGNCRVDARVVTIDRQGKTITAEGMFHDLESNVATRATVTRSIATSKGFLFSPDMIAVAGNAACSIAKRNAILAGVPKGVWRKAVDASEQIIRGDAKTLVERRDRAIKAFAHFNLSPDQVFQIMEVQGADDIGLDDLATLFAFFGQLKNGETTAEELLRKAAPGGGTHDAVKNPLDDKGGEAKPKEENPLRGKTAAQAAARNGPGKDVSGGGAPEAGGQEEAAPAEPDPAAIDAAYVAGEQAKAKGSTPKAMPKDLRAPERKAEADAWLAGFEGREIHPRNDEEGGE